jgi:excisionase family DNA binding protein
MMASRLHYLAIAVHDLHIAHEEVEIPGTEALPKMLRVEEAAKVARISRRHAYHLVSTGQLPSVRLGNAIRVPTLRLLELLEGAEEKAAAP